ncbi:hypothetical protein OEZ86_005600 [Tetradesmus obliquus]|nr:hypothetical protein OEZ86_005600 [Tetradesmus obliquus]
MRGFSAGRLCRGLLEVGCRAAAMDCTVTAAAAQQQWPSLWRQGASLFSTSRTAAAGLCSQGSAVQQLCSSSSSSGVSSLSNSRALSSLTQTLSRFQQQQQQPLLMSAFAQTQQQPLLPGRPLGLPLAFKQQQGMLQQQQRGSVRSFVLMPRRIKYRKAHKSMGFNETICGNTRQLAFGLYGIRAMEHCRIPARTLEAARRTLRRTIKKTAMLWIRVTPNVPVTSKPAEVRMGKGKGTLDYWAAPVRAGQILFEMDRCSKADVQAALHSIQAKMPIKLGFVEWS